MWTCLFCGTVVTEFSRKLATVTGIVCVPTTFAQVPTGRHLLVEDHVKQYKGIGVIVYGADKEDRS